MKSKKEIVPLDQILEPFTFTPTVTLQGSVNGKNFYYPSGQEATLTFPEYEVLMNAGYEEILYSTRNNLGNHLFDS